MTYQKPPTPEDALEHFGVKGMRWGVRNRQLNKASRAGDRATAKRSAKAYNGSRNAKIDAARTALSSGKVARDFQAAKAQKKVDKVNLGSRQARKNFRLAKDKREQTIQTANLIKSGKETTNYLLGVAGGVAVGTALNIAIANRQLNRPGPMFM